MIPPRSALTRTRPAAPIELHRTARPVTAVHPVLAEIARTRPGYTDARIDGRPIRIYIERPRYRLVVPWLKVIALLAVIVIPTLGLVWLVTEALSWAARHWYMFAAAFALVVLVPALGRLGVCCPGLHCPGCGHR